MYAVVMSRGGRIVAMVGVLAGAAAVADSRLLAAVVAY